MSCRTRWRFLVPSLVLLVTPWLAAFAASDNATLRSVVIISRHGVRAPLDAPDKMAPYSAEPWPKWGVPPGHLTPRGKQLVALMGAYYRERYLAAGLLTGDRAADRARVFLRANNFQRTLETARGLSQGILGEEVEIHALPEGTVDALFVPARIRYGEPDEALAVAAVRGRLGADPSAFARTYRTQFARLHRILFGKTAAVLPPGKLRLLDLPLGVQPGEGNDLISTTGSLALAKTFIENLMLEYAEGMPAADVGWGRVNRAAFADLAQLHAIDFSLCHGTFYVAQVQISNMAGHVLQTLEQASSGRAVAGAIGPTGARLVVLAGHDMNIISIAGLLDLDWSVDSLPMDPALPGGALVFELWRHADGADFVRTFYMTQTLDQMHTAAKLSLAAPPAVTAVFIPGCSTAGPDYEAPLGRFATRLRQVIDPRFVTPQP